ncbi:hypothetical protein Tco_0714394 [Tanacetum coccineum]
MIDQCIVDALEAHDADRSMNGDDSHYSGTDVRRNEQATRECTYPDFMKCQPLNFKGTEGVFELTQWFEEMETVFRISNYSVENQIKFSTCTLLGSALTWWNSHIRTVGHDDLKVKESDKVEKYVGGLPDMRHGSVVASKPKTMQDAIEVLVVKLFKGETSDTKPPRKRVCEVAYCELCGQTRFGRGVKIIRKKMNNGGNLTASNTQPSNASKVNDGYILTRRMHAEIFGKCTKNNVVEPTMYWDVNILKAMGIGGT